MSYYSYFCFVIKFIVSYYRFTENLSVLEFFKQKTAYEILRSDWSSDVCSSDLKYALEAIINELLFIFLFRD